MPSSETIRIIVTLTIGFILYFTLSVITMKRNIVKVVKIFEDKGALSAKTAISGTELNIRKQGFVDRTFRKRDNRHHALKFLMDGGVVITTTYDRYYLDKKRMIAFKKGLNFIGQMMIPNIDN